MKTKMKMGVQVLVSDPEKLDAIRQRELDITKERIEKVLRAGANVVLTTQVLFGFIVLMLRHPLCCTVPTNMSCLSPVSSHSSGH